MLAGRKGEKNFLRITGFIEREISRVIRKRRNRFFDYYPSLSWHLGINLEHLIKKSQIKKTKRMLSLRERFLTISLDRRWLGFPKRNGACKGKSDRVDFERVFPLWVRYFIFRSRPS